jgi:hypothetical protein
MMKKILILLILFVSATLLAQEPVAIITKIKGDIELTHSGEVSQCKAGTILYNLDELVSEDNSYAAIKFVDGGGLLKLFPNSHLIVKAEKDGKALKKNSYLSKGNVFAKVKKKVGSFQIETPTTVASVKGTQFIVFVTPTGETHVMTLEGLVEMINPDGNSSEVGPNQQGQSTGQGSIVVIALEEGDIPEEILNEISEDVDKKEIRFKVEKDGEEKEIIIEIE